MKKRRGQESVDYFKNRDLERGGEGKKRGRWHEEGETKAVKECKEREARTGRLRKRKGEEIDE